MKMHFGQLQKEPCRKDKPRPSKASVPSWAPPAWIIPLIEGEVPARKKPPKDDAPAIRLPLDDGVPLERVPDSTPKEDGERGVVIIDLRA